MPSAFGARCFSFSHRAEGPDCTPTPTFNPCLHISLPLGLSLKSLPKLRGSAFCCFLNQQFLVWGEGVAGGGPFRSLSTLSPRGDLVLAHSPEHLPGPGNSHIRRSGPELPSQLHSFIRQTYSEFFSISGAAFHVGCPLVARVYGPLPFLLSTPPHPARSGPPRHLYRPLPTLPASGHRALSSRLSPPCATTIHPEAEPATRVSSLTRPSHTLILSLTHHTLNLDQRPILHPGASTVNRASRTPALGELPFQCHGEDRPKDE